MEVDLTRKYYYKLCPKLGRVHITVVYAFYLLFRVGICCCESKHDHLHGNDDPLEVGHAWTCILIFFFPTAPELYGKSSGSAR